MNDSSAADVGRRPNLQIAARMVLVRSLLFAIIALMLRPAHAQSGMQIHMHGEGLYAADGVLYEPAGQGPFSAILLIPDERGLTRRVTESAECFAKAGYVAVAIDLNRGMPESTTKPSDEQIGLDLDAALAFLAHQPNMRQGKIGVMGWGSGGINALRLAADGKVAAVAFESVVAARGLTNLKTFSAPVLGIFAARDPQTAPQSIKMFERRLRTLTASVTVKVYAGADRGFDDPDDAQYSNTDASDARRISLDFFASQFLSQATND